MLPNISLTLSNGHSYSLTDYQDYVILVVNTATQCGLTPQFSGLEALYQQFREQKFVVLGFPSNQFAQETLSDDAMASACQLNFGVTFPLHQRCQVNGDEAHPLFEWLKQEQGGLLTSAIKWNFTKFLIDRNGKVIKRYAPQVTPEQIGEDVATLI
ncbi:MAG: glutathione peroxidase [Aerococcaceae bacterium]|nr:glutathione peroxidase [Aerococcaceae bacterium]